MDTDMDTDVDMDMDADIDMEEKISQKRLCKRCLTRDMVGQEEYFKSLHEYIANLDPEVKVCDSLYEERLDICRECGLLFQGMCRTCGCYVELRAALAAKECPGHKW